MGIYTSIFAAIIVLLASFVRAASGFGYALLATPLLTLVMEAKSVVVLNMILGSLSNILVFWHTRRYIDLKRVVVLGLGSIFGIPAGTYLLVKLEPSIIKLAIAIVVIPFSILLLLGHSHRFKRDTLGCAVAGFLSGLLGGSTGLGGPPVVLFLINQGLTPQMFVGTLAAYFLFNGAILVATFTFLGMVTADILIKVAILLPTLWLGSYIGVKMLPRINTVVFKKIASAIVAATAVIIVASIVMDM
ncbi:MAG: sulfite exporter TauE/SafE family protein [Dehalococcoidales bacterium]|nr:sulfite exporter TauE/SafE family protein [Dehalococcoidales bacterium]